MKKFFLVCLALCTGVANATLIDFDDLVQDTVVSNQYAGLGVSFSAFENGVAVNSPLVHDEWQNSQNVLGRDGMGLSNCYDTWAQCTRADVLRIDFTGTASGISWLQNNEGSMDPVWELYDISGSLIETINVDGPSSWFAVTAASSKVSYMLGLQPRDNWTWSIDNLQFTLDDNSTDVPEPTSIAILSLGLVGLALRRKSK